jgi:hypothetical protein
MLAIMDGEDERIIQSIPLSACLDAEWGAEAMQGRVITPHPGLPTLRASAETELWRTGNGR